MASITLTKVTYGGTAAKLRPLFHGRKFLKLLKRRQAMPEIPLSVGSKLELLFCLCQISVYFPVHSRICPRMHVYTCILAIYNVHDRGAEGFAL